MDKYRVIITARSFGTADNKAVELLEQYGCGVVKLKVGRESVSEQLKRELPMSDAVIAGLEEYSTELIGSAPRLKVISRYGVGYDNVDVSAASDKGIKVTITPGANADSVADMAMALMLAAARNITLMDASMKAENQQRIQGVEMCRKTIGIVGTGKIGQAVARRCRGFDMNILCYDKYENETLKNEFNVKYVDFDTIVQEADFITIHAPLTLETENMFGAKEFSMMKKDAILVNTARGGIVNEKALYEALKNGEIRAAALDATVSEPPYGQDILELSNCIITPHAGALTKEASSKMSIMAAENVIKVLSGKDCIFAVN